MKKFASLLACGVVAASLLSTSAFAAVEKGQKLYLKNCKECHGNGVKGAAMATQSGWDRWFAAGGKALIDKHTKDAKASKYFGGPFKDHAPDLHDFLKEYGSDSGNVPACG